MMQYQDNNYAGVVDDLETRFDKGECKCCGQKIYWGTTRERYKYVEGQRVRVGGNPIPLDPRPVVWADGGRWLPSPGRVGEEETARVVYCDPTCGSARFIRCHLETCTAPSPEDDLFQQHVRRKERLEET